VRAERHRVRRAEVQVVRVVLGPGGRADLTKLPAFLAGEQYRSLMIESGSKLNWAVLESGIVDKIFFYYAPKILGGLKSVPVAGGAGSPRPIESRTAQRLLTADEGLTNAAAFHSVYPVPGVHSHALQASKHDHPDYGDADLDASQKVQ